MAIQEQERETGKRKRFRNNALRLLVIYPLAWIVVSVVLYYLVKK